MVALQEPCSLLASEFRRFHPFGGDQAEFNPPTSSIENDTVETVIRFPRYRPRFPPASNRFRGRAD
jgi:hypothetical protein